MSNRPELQRIVTEWAIEGHCKCKNQLIAQYHYLHCENYGFIQATDLNQIVPYVTHFLCTRCIDQQNKTNPNTFLTMKIHPKGLLQEWKTLSLFLHRVPVGLVVQSLFGWTCTKFRPVSWATSTAFPFQELGASCPPRREQQFIAFQF